MGVEAVIRTRMIAVGLVMAAAWVRRMGQPEAWRHVAKRCRVRYFTDGIAIGGKAFVDGVFERNRRFLGSRRKDGVRKMRFADWGDLRVARALRIEPVSACQSV